MIFFFQNFLESCFTALQSIIRALSTTFINCALAAKLLFLQAVRNEIYHRYKKEKVVPDKGHHQSNLGGTFEEDLVHPSGGWGWGHWRRWTESSSQTGSSLPLDLNILFHESTRELCSGDQNPQEYKKQKHQAGFLLKV